jgi:hypothetical protein
MDNLQRLLTYFTQPRVLIHDMFPFGFLDEIAGLGSYASRALVMRGEVFSGFEDEKTRKNIVLNHEMLKAIGIGADKLTLIRGSDLVGGIIREDNVFNHFGQIRRAVAAGMPLDFYLSRGLEPFVQKLGIGWDKISTVQPTTAAMFDDKYRLRCIGIDNPKMQQAFAAYERISLSYNKLENAYDAVDAVRQRIIQKAMAIIPTNTVYLKAEGLDGGVGILRWDQDTPRSVVEEFLQKFAGHGLLVDAGYPEIVFETKNRSMKVLFHATHWEPLFFSTNLSAKDAHEGNIVAIGQDEVDPETQALAIAKFGPFCDEAVGQGYGVLMPRSACVDFLEVKYNGKVYVFMLEWNARTSASDYAMAVCVEAFKKFGCGKAAVMMKNVSGLPRGLTLTEACKDHFSGTLWDGSNRSGYLPINAGCLNHEGKLTALTIAPTLEEAKKMFKGLRTPKRTSSTDSMPRVRIQA